MGLVGRLKHCAFTDPDTASLYWHIREGIICIPRGAVVPDGTLI